MRDRCTMLWKKIQYRVPYDMSDRRWLIAMYTMSFSILAFLYLVFFLLWKNTDWRNGRNVTGSCIYAI